MGAANSLQIRKVCDDRGLLAVEVCRAIEPLKDADIEKLNAIVLTAEPGDITAVCYLAEHLDRFDFIPDIHTPEEYGRFRCLKNFCSSSIYLLTFVWLSARIISNCRLRSSSGAGSSSCPAALPLDM